MIIIFFPLLLAAMNSQSENNKWIGCRISFGGRFDFRWNFFVSFYNFFFYHPSNDEMKAEIDNNKKKIKKKNKILIKRFKRFGGGGGTREQWESLTNKTKKISTKKFIN